MDRWNTPSFIEIDMSAEIGGYQGDFEDGPNAPDHLPDFVEDAATSDLG
jgi:coenzyme PQQ precursor peptide PqqA